MNRKENGFTYIEVMLTLLVVTLISFAGWYIYTQSKSDSNQTASPNQVDKVVAKDGKYKTFSHKELSFTFKYPADWETLDNSTDYGFYSVRLRAPGTIVESCQGECLKAGAQILLVRNPVSMQGNVLIDSLDKFKVSSVQAKYLTNLKTIQVDGVKMLEYDNDSTKEGGTNLHGVQFFKDSVDYSFTLDNKQYTQVKYGKVFDAIIRSVKFN